jgi:hypothetical protein
LKFGAANDSWCGWNQKQGKAASVGVCNLSLATGNPLFLGFCKFHVSGHVRAVIAGPATVPFHFYDAADQLDDEAQLVAVLPRDALSDLPDRSINVWFHDRILAPVSKRDSAIVNLGKLRVCYDAAPLRGPSTMNLKPARGTRDWPERLGGCSLASRFCCGVTLCPGISVLLSQCAGRWCHSGVPALLPSRTWPRQSHRRAPYADTSPASSILVAKRRTGDGGN